MRKTKNSTEDTIYNLHLQKQIWEDLTNLNCSENVNEDLKLEHYEVLNDINAVSHVSCGSEETKHFE